MGAAKPSQCNEPQKNDPENDAFFTCHHGPLCFLNQAKMSKFPQGRLLQAWLHGQLSRSPTSTHEDLYCRSTKSGHRCGHSIMAQLAQRGILPWLPKVWNFRLEDHEKMPPGEVGFEGKMI